MAIAARKMRTVLRIVILLFISFANVVSAESTVECKFTKYMRYADGHAIDPDYLQIEQFLKIVKNKTSNDTLDLDGALRAVNSEKWFIEDSYNLFYTGNRGEVLTIITGRKSNDLFDAQLISFGVKRGSITELKGLCSVEP
ncbi:TPA: hypothetical protein ACMDSY_004445 [Vibrio parahaemolyticus]|nr:MULTISPECIES: hypothetical protein [Vibrio harveyi group]EHH2484499.1 hypothetical protein [Vibrio parahaemolyticus]EIV8659988.1 hypothetical protein [Vibrio parahaemolyticus]EIZ1047484.1 hypothetical protein [Vibrio parahaemolyticus]EIZ1340459.1 hypothetical protein [Vibrio parahaemolyticus]